MASILAVLADKPGASPRPQLLGFVLAPKAECIVAGLCLRAMTNAAVTVYTTSWCGFCHRLMTVLKSDGIPYDAVDIEQDAAAAEFVGSVNGGNRTVPTVKFADGSTLTNPSAAEVKAKLAEVAG
jgi:mycoredoxin